jgi:hypothetical protein
MREHAFHSSRPLVAGGLVAVGAGSAGMVDLHLTSRLNPLSETISDYLFDPNGWLLPVSLIVLAVGGAMLAVALVWAGSDGRASWLVGLWSTCLLLVAAFPTDRPGLPLSISGQIHRYAAFVAFLSLPLAGLIVARRGGYARTVKGLSVVALAALTAVTVPYAAVALGLNLVGLPGLTQRMVVVTEVALLATFGLVALRPARREEVRVGLDRVGVPDLDRAGLGVDHQDAHAGAPRLGDVGDVRRDLVVAGPVDRLGRVGAA